MVPSTPFGAVLLSFEILKTKDLLMCTCNIFIDRRLTIGTGRRLITGIETWHRIRVEDDGAGSHWDQG